MTTAEAIMKAALDGTFRRIVNTSGNEREFTAYKTVQVPKDHIPTHARQERMAPQKLHVKRPKQPAFGRRFAR